ncbi:hypothetical protein DRJ25_03135 [Candidatus Woesearchaeota archaeon]|nr:MAG: hypothetical protein DRJ25_03135 [Candidatus Woesearchaeota archaeon]
MLKDFLRQFNKADLVNFDNVLRIQDSFFLKPDDPKLRKNFNRFAEDVKTNGLKFVGIPLGSKSKRVFAPSIFLLELLRDAKVPFIKVNKKGEWLFVCGRDIQGANIYKASCEKDQFALVLNLKAEPLGYGRLVRKPSGTRIAFKRIYDIGDYLRRER